VVQLFIACLEQLPAQRCAFSAQHMLSSLMK